MIDFPYFLYAYNQPTRQKRPYQSEVKERFAGNAVHFGLLAPQAFYFAKGCSVQAWSMCEGHHHDPKKAKLGFA